jgi:Protein of unknown function (DUF2442)
MAIITEHQKLEADARMKERVAAGPSAVSVSYRRAEGRIMIELSNGSLVGIPASEIQGLEQASPEDLEVIELTPLGDGLHFPAVDADLYLPALLADVLGSRTFMARRLGKAGGASRSALKAEAARVNGARGGRPRKATAPSREKVEA